MLSIFRTNNIIVTVLLLLYALGLHIASFLFPNPISDAAAHGVLMKWIFDWIGQEGIVPNIFTILLIFAQALLVSSLVNRYRLSRETNLFPGVFFLLLTASSPSFLYLSPLHFANIFLIFSLMEVMHTYRVPSTADRIFNTGLWIAVASLFYFSYIIFLVLGFIALNVLRAFKIRERLMLLIGAIVPYCLIAVYYFWNDQLAYFYSEQITKNWGFLDFTSPLSLVDFISLGLSSILLLIVLMNFTGLTLKMNIQSQKNISILFWTLLISSFTLFLQANIGLQHLLVLSVPLAILLGLWVSRLQARWSEVVHFLLLITVLIIQYQNLLIPK